MTIVDLPLSPAPNHKKWFYKAFFEYFTFSKFADLPRSKSLTSNLAFSPSLRNSWSIFLLLSAASFSRALTAHPILKFSNRSHQILTVTISKFIHKSLSQTRFSGSKATVKFTLKKERIFFTPVFFFFQIWQISSKFSPTQRSSYECNAWPSPISDLSTPAGMDRVWTRFVTSKENRTIYLLFFSALTRYQKL